MTFQPVNIKGALISEYEYNGWYFQAEMYKEYVHKMPQNAICKVLEYDQKKDKSCVPTSACAMITYNSGLEFAEWEIREMWQEYQGDQGGSAYKTTTQIGQRFMLEHFPVDTDSPEFEMLLDKRWAVQVAIWTDGQFYIDAMNNGVVNEIHRIPGPDFEIYKHELIMYRTPDRRTVMQNSWKATAPYNIFDVTDVYEAMLKNSLIRPCGMVCMPYSQDVYPGMKVTFKHYTKALARMGQVAVTDVWNSYKRHYAKLDGVIDAHYKIK